VRFPLLHFMRGIVRRSTYWNNHIRPSRSKDIWRIAALYRVACDCDFLLDVAAGSTL